MVPLLAFALAVARPDIREGYCQVPGGQVYYRIVGSGPRPPIVVLHGGPGVPHDYLMTLDGLATDRAVVYYDQLGCGRSDRPSDPKLWTIERACKELLAVRSYLGLKTCVLFGHSWGTILATEAVLRGAKGVEALILAGPAMNTKRWERDAAAMVAQLPRADREAIAKGNRLRVYDAPDYQAAVMHYYRRHLLRLDNWPQSVQDTFAGIGQDVYQTMAGPNEFVMTGSLRGYDSTPRLRMIRKPTLLICGEYDEATPGATRDYHRAIPGSEIVVMGGASHLSNVEQPQRFNRIVGSFLRRL